MTVGKQVNVGIKIVHLIVFDFVKKREIYSTIFPRRIEFYARGSSAADDDDGAVRQNLIRGVPSALGELNIFKFLPITTERSRVGRSSDTRSELADFLEAVEVAAGVEEGAVGEELAGGAPGVGEDHEGSDGVGGEVEEDGVSVTVFF